VSSVGSQSEFAKLMQKVSTTPRPQPQRVERSLEDIQGDINTRVKPALDNIWPEEAPLQHFSLALGSTGIVLNAQYESTKDLDPITTNLIQKRLQERLKSPGLTPVHARRCLPANKTNAPDEYRTVRSPMFYLANAARWPTATGNYVLGETEARCAPGDAEASLKKSCLSHASSSSPHAVGSMSALAYHQLNIL